MCPFSPSNTTGVGGELWKNYSGPSKTLMQLPNNPGTAGHTHRRMKRGTQNTQMSVAALFTMIKIIMNNNNSNTIKGVYEPTHRKRWGGRTLVNKRMKSRRMEQYGEAYKTLVYAKEPTHPVLWKIGIYCMTLLI